MPQRRGDRIQWVRVAQGAAELGPNRATTGGSALSKSTWIGMAVPTELNDELAIVPSPDCATAFSDPRIKRQARPREGVRPS